MGSKFVHVEVYVIFHIVPFPRSDLSAILSAASEERHMSQERRRKGAHQDSHHPNDRCVKSCMLLQSQHQQITYSSKKYFAVLTASYYNRRDDGILGGVTGAAKHTVMIHVRIVVDSNAFFRSNVYPCTLRDHVTRFVFF